jgi:hypothetical protein
VSYWESLGDIWGSVGKFWGSVGKFLGKFCGELKTSSQREFNRYIYIKWHKKYLVERKMIVILGKFWETFGKLLGNSWETLM